MRHFKLAQLGLAAAAFFAASAASAAMVTTWDYTVTSQFRDGASVFVPSGTNPGNPANPNSSFTTSDYLLTWGRTGGTLENGQRSGLGIDPFSVSGSATTNGAFVAANSYTHYNNSNLGADSWTLRSTIIDATLTLTPTSPAGAPLDPFTAQYSVRFIETPNTNTTCPSGPEETPCSDIFIMVGSLGEPFTYDGVNYSFLFDATGFEELDPRQCELAGLEAGCFGFSTPEGADYTSDFSFRIVALSEVPEPGSLALLGAGLLGLAGLRSRKQKKSTKA